MIVKTAVAIAVEHIKTLFEHEQLSNVGLEEVEFDHDRQEWIVTIGFSRPWDYPDNNALASLTGKTAAPKRSLKVIIISDTDEAVLSVKNWVDPRAMPF